MLRQLILATAIVSTATWAGQANAEPVEEQTSVVVSILPQKNFVQRIGGESTEIQVLVQPGHSPATYEPTPKQMAHLAEADMWIRLGVAFENSVLRNVADVAPGLVLVDGTTGIELRRMDHHHEDAAVTSHQTDPHFWLDPLLVKQHARNITDALCEHSTPGCDEYRSNLARFEADLDLLHRRVAERLAPVKGRELFVFHPAYGYLADRYGLLQVAVETGGKRPTARQTAGLVDAARASGATAMFVQPQFSGSSARAIADAIGVNLVELDPLAEDYFANLHTMAARIVAAYGD
jgi:zinc transport system substrate-binding protein